jgi:methyl-accepting chemotaxis protein
MLKRFLQLNLAVKMMSGFAATAAITLGVGWLGLRGITLDNAAIETLYKRHVEGVSNLKQAQVELLRALSGQKNALVAYTPEQRDANLNEMRRAEASFGAIMTGLQREDSAGERTQHQQIERYWAEFRKANAEIATRLANSEAEQAFQLSNGAARESFERIQAELETAAQLRKDQSRQEYEASLERNQSAGVWLIGLALLGSGLGLTFGYVISRLVAGPVRDIVTGFDRLERGDLTHRLKIESKDEIGVLAAAYNRVLERLRGVVGDVQTSSSRVWSAVASVSARAGAAHGTNAATIEATATAIRQIAAAAEQNAATAAQAAREFDAAQGSSVRGRDAVQRMTEAVLQINESSKKISQIIHVMDEIAFQTNLLALNAAVEAAHAGDEGKGFAVVAAEVRALAQRSADAAKDIAQLIEDSVARAAAGRELAVQSGSALEEIAQNVERVSEMVKSMAHSSNEQRQAMHEANLAIARIDEAMQQNAEEVKHLTGTVSYFRIE